MKRKVLISTTLFRIIILTLLGIAVIIWLRWLIVGSGPYRWLQQRLLWLGQRESESFGALLSFVLLFIVWLVPTLILRYMSPLLWFTEQALTPGFNPVPGQRRSLMEQFRHSLNTQRQKQADMLFRPGDDPQRRRFYRRMGWAGLGVGILGCFVTWMIWYLEEELWAMPLALGLVGILGGPLSILTGKPIIFDWQKTQTIQNIVRWFGIAFLVLTMLFLAVMCVLEAL